MPQSHIHSHNEIVPYLQKNALEIRKSIIKMLETAQSGHSAGSLGMADVFSALYFHIANIDPQNPQDPQRDRVVLSNGHISPVLYSTLALRGFFPEEELNTFRKINSRLQGHPHNLDLPGVETSSGPLGQGASQAVGMALAAKLDKKDYRVYLLGSDGELQEGQTWEAAMFAGNKKLNNLTWIIDRNNIQIDGYTEELMPVEPLRAKLESFNWYVLEIDGHNLEEIVNAVNMSKAIFERPTAIIAHTVPGKGVDFMEYKFEWHGKPPSPAEAKDALKQLEKLESQKSKIK